MITATPRSEDLPEMPAFLRRYQLDGQTLAVLIKSLQQVISHLRGYGPEYLNQSEIQTLDDLCEALKLIERRESPPQGEYRFQTLGQDGEYKFQRGVIDPSTIALKAKLKEQIAVKIVRAIEDGHDTFARIRKALPVLHIRGEDIKMPDRVLKSGLRYLMSGKLAGVRMVKLTRRSYATEKMLSNGSWTAPWRRTKRLT